MDILEQIVAKKRLRLAQAQQKYSLTELKAHLQPRSGQRLYQALSQPGVNIIAEIKRASPSKGLICKDFDPLAIAQTYQAAGAVAISILTEEDYFQGSLEILKAVRAVVTLPILRKDFIFDEYQVYEAAQAGADAFLLIAALLTPKQMTNLIHLGNELGLDALVEVHTATELTAVLTCPATIIGINNRNLKTFQVDLNTSLELAKISPKAMMLVSESGINNASDIAQLQPAGFKAFLVGEQLMRASNPGQALQALISSNY